MRVGVVLEAFILYETSARAILVKLCIIVYSVDKIFEHTFYELLKRIISVILLHNKKTWRSWGFTPKDQLAAHMKSRLQ